MYPALRLGTRFTVENKMGVLALRSIQSSGKVRH